MFISAEYDALWTLAVAAIFSALVLMVCAIATWIARGGRDGLGWLTLAVFAPVVGPIIFLRRARTERS